MRVRLVGGWRRASVKTLEPAAAYAAWAPSYPPRAHNLLMEIEERAVLARLPDVAGRTVVDLGCGSGRYAAVLRQRGARVVLGLDRSPEMLARARDAVPLVVLGDLRALPVRDGAIDVAVCGLAVGDVPELGEVIAGVARALRPGGRVVYSDLHPRGAAAGWRRTFDAFGRRYAVRHHRHTIDAHLAACRAAGLVVEIVDEPAIEIDHAFRGWPAALVVTARKPVPPWPSWPS